MEIDKEELINKFRKAIAADLEYGTAVRSLAEHVGCEYDAVDSDRIGEAVRKVSVGVCGELEADEAHILEVMWWFLEDAALV